MAIIQRSLGLALLPVFALLILQTLYPDSLRTVQEAVQPYLINTPLFRGLITEQLPARSETPLVVAAVAHWSHYEKIAKIAIVLADLGYPITFITGRIFQDDVEKLHPNITFWPIQGKPDKLTEEDYEFLKTLAPGSVEEELFMLKRVFIEGMPDQHDTLQQVFREFRERYGEEKPLLSLYDLPFTGHHPILLGAPGIKPDASLGLSCHPLTLDSKDTFPFYMGKQPHGGPDAKDVHHEAYQAENMDHTTRVVSEAYWKKVQDMGAVEEHDWNFYHALSTVPEYLMTLGIPDFEFARTDLRPNIHYFGGLKSKKIQDTSEANLPDWWDDIAASKRAGKQIVAVSQGTLGMNLKNLLIPTLDALKDESDVLVIATTVTVEVKDVPDLVIPSNARVAKFVPYDLLLPQVDVLVNNGGYGAVIQSLQLGIPMVLAGQGQDKNVTNTIVEWKEVGVNLGRMDPSVEEIHDGVTKVLKDGKYKRNIMAMSKSFEKYDMGIIFDRVIQNVIRDWLKAKRLSKSLH